MQKHIVLDILYSQDENVAQKALRLLASFYKRMPMSVLSIHILGQVSTFLWIVSLTMGHTANKERTINSINYWKGEKVRVEAKLQKSLDRLYAKNDSLVAMKYVSKADREYSARIENLEMRMDTTTVFYNIKIGILERRLSRGSIISPIAAIENPTLRTIIQFILSWLLSTTIDGAYLAAIETATRLRYLKRKGDTVVGIVAANGSGKLMLNGKPGKILAAVLAKKGMPIYLNSLELMRTNPGLSARRYSMIAKKQNSKKGKPVFNNRAYWAELLKLHRQEHNNG
jgi:hypothetical protein